MKTPFVKNDYAVTNGGHAVSVISASGGVILGRIGDERDPVLSWSGHTGKAVRSPGSYNLRLRNLTGEKVTEDRADLLLQMLLMEFSPHGGTRNKLWHALTSEFLTMYRAEESGFTDEYPETYIDNMSKAVSDLVYHHADQPREAAS